MSTRRSQLRRTSRPALLIAGAVLLCGCSTPIVGDYIPTAAGGLPEGAPQRSTTPPAYPAVNDLPPARDHAVLTEEEQKKLEADLTAARNRVGNQAGAAGKPATSTRNP